MKSEEDSLKAERDAKKLSTMSFIVSASAIFISVATLIVSIYQSTIMYNQQKASVWPYVEWTIGMSTIDGLFLDVKNKGVGPAIIKSTQLTLDGKSIKGPRALMNALTNGKADSIYSFTVTVDKRVLSPGEELRFFHMKDSSLLKIKFGNLYDRIKYSICYCSIYGDCWTSTGLEVVESKCD